MFISGGARVFAARGKRLVAASTPAIRSPIDILMVTTMALVWTVNMQYAKLGGVIT